MGPTTDLFEVSPKALGIFEWSFSEFDHVLAIKATVEGTSKGRVFLDDKEKPSVVILWNEFDGFYIGISEKAAPEKTSKFIEYILERNGESLQGLSQFVIYTDLMKSDTFVQKMVPSDTFEKRWVKQFQKTKVTKSETKIPSGYKHISVEQLITGDNHYINAGEIAEGITQTWASVDVFLRHGFGTCLVRDARQEVASYCFTEHVSATGAELSVETYEAYQRLGLGNVVGLSTLEMCAQRKLTPYWYCLSDNAGSIALAKKLGMREVLTFPVWFFSYPSVPNG